MRYYYQAGRYQERSLKRLRETLEPTVESIEARLGAVMNTTINHYWTRKDTFGFIFADFEYTPDVHQRLIGKGELDLFARLKNDYYCVVLSKITSRNFDAFDMGNGRQCIRINLSFFKEFLQTVRDKTVTVPLFLYKFDSREHETFIRRWLRSYDGFEEVQEETRTDGTSILDVVEKLGIDDAHTLEELIAIARKTQSKVWSDIEPYEVKLKEFKSLVDADVPESKLHDYLFDNLWMIDVRYQFYQKRKKEDAGPGEVDISLYQDSTGIEHVAIIELKRADEKTLTDSYRGSKKPVIMAEFGKALSQTIHYVDSVRSSKRIVEGILIIGRRDDVKGWFITKFNDYLHGIHVLTYNDVIDRASDIIAMLKEMHDEGQKTAQAAMLLEKADEVLPPTSNEGITATENPTTTNISPGAPGEEPSNETIG